MRYTPAGLPALDLKLKHESEVSEDGLPRKVSLEIKAVAIGAVTQVANALALGSPCSFVGFLAATRNGKGLVFHVNEIVPTEPASV